MIDTSLKGLAQSLIDEVSLLMRQELRLAKAEISEDLAFAQRRLVAIIAGLLLGFCAILILLQAVVIALAAVMPAWLASVIVAVIVGLIAFGLIKSGQSGLQDKDFTPKRSARSLQRDKEMVAEKMS